MSTTRKPFIPRPRCASEGCTRPAKHLAVDEFSDGIPEAFCEEHLLELTGEPELCAECEAGRWWWTWDEVRAHHHVLAVLLLADLCLRAGVAHWLAWLALVLLGVAAFGDILATRRRARWLWPLSIVPLLLGVVVAGYCGSPPVVPIAVGIAVLHAVLLRRAAYEALAGRRLDPGR